jgi:hypothetical protein
MIREGAVEKSAQGMTGTDRSLLLTVTKRQSGRVVPVIRVLGHRSDDTESVVFVHAFASKESSGFGRDCA